MNDINRPPVIPQRRMPSCRNVNSISPFGGLQGAGGIIRGHQKKNADLFGH